MRTKPLAIAGAIGFALLAGGAGAQDYGYATPQYSYNSSEEVIVRPPYQKRGMLGGPIEDVALSTPVRYDDLDLSTAWGVRTLRERISTTAYVLCRRLNVMHPVSADSSGWSSSDRCYRRAVHEAMEQVWPAIGGPRYGYRD